MTRINPQNHCLKRFIDALVNLFAPQLLIQLLPEASLSGRHHVSADAVLGFLQAPDGDVLLVLLPGAAPERAAGAVPALLAGVLVGYPLQAAGHAAEDLGLLATGVAVLPPETSQPP